jgi:ribosomal protein L2
MSIYNIFRVVILLILITSGNLGGGHKRLFRLVDVKRRKFGLVARVFSIEYDPNRTSKISLIIYVDGEKSYILAPRGLVVGVSIISDFYVPISLGNHTILSKIPVGTLVHNVEFQVCVKFFFFLILFFIFVLAVCQYEINKSILDL